MKMTVANCATATNGLVVTALAGESIVSGSLPDTINREDEMNFTRDQVGVLRRLVEVSEDRLNAADLATVEQLTDVLDAQLDYQEVWVDNLPTNEEIEDMARLAGQELPF